MFAIYTFMAKHFEELWEKAEALSLQTDRSDISLKIEEINESLGQLLIDKNESSQARQFGKILFKLCGISRNLNINTFSALLLEIQNQRVDIMGE